LFERIHPATDGTAEEAGGPVAAEEDAIGAEGVEAVIHDGGEVFDPPALRLTIFHGVRRCL
jgi:hypothetical protein